MSLDWPSTHASARERVEQSPARQSDFLSWRAGFQRTITDRITEFVTVRCAPQLDATGVGITRDLLLSFLDGGKCLRSTFLYIGWLCRADHDDAAVSAAGSLELLHAFALLQDDVMDCSPLRRGRPSAHVRFAEWHRGRGLSGSADRFGESAAVLLGDLCLVWAEQMLRECGLKDAALARAWPRYDHMRTELAVGQFADLVNDAGGFPSLEHVLDVSRRKSGNYTVRRPLEIGGLLSDCSPGVLSRLSGYGDAIGQAFQLRDDLLGVFGAPSVTGKPASVDLSEHKATSVVVAAHQLADPSARKELSALMRSTELTPSDIDRWRTLIAATGAREWIEHAIEERSAHALDLIDTDEMTEAARTALFDMAAICTDRVA